MTCKVQPPEQNKLPLLLILDAEGNVLAKESAPASAAEGGEAARIDSEKLLALLERCKAEAEDAEKLLASALATAKETGRRVFIHFDAPW